MPSKRHAEPQQQQQPHEPWHLDKRVPVAIIVTLVMQTGGFIWWAATLSGTVEGHSTAIAEIRAYKVTERLPVIEYQVGVMSSDIKKIADKIDRLLETDDRARAARVPNQ